MDWIASDTVDWLGWPGSGMIGGMEKSSDSDSTGASDISRPSKVTGAPSICNRTQTQTKRISTEETAPSGTSPRLMQSIQRMARTIPKHRLAGKQDRQVDSQAWIGQDHCLNDRDCE